MKFCLRIVLLLFLVTGTLTDGGFDLSDALDSATSAPKEPPKAPEKPKSDDLTPVEKPKKDSGDSGGFGFNLDDALGPDPNPKPDKPAVDPPKNGGDDRPLDDSDLGTVADGDYKPDGGRSGGGGAMDPGNDHGGADQPQEAGSGQIAGIASAIGVALLGAASSYFAYQKKKLCFKLQGGADPESGKGQHGTQSEPQVLSNLLRTN